MIGIKDLNFPPALADTSKENGIENLSSQCR